MPEKDPVNKELSTRETRRIEALRLYREKFAPQIDSVYYPFCGSDITPWIAFPQADIVGVDRNDLAVDHIRKQGIGKLAICDALDFRPPHLGDTLLMLGWRATIQECTYLKDWVKPGGHIVTDLNWVAGVMMGHFKSSMDLVGRIDNDLNVETFSDPLTPDQGLGHLRYLVDERESTGTNTMIALQAALTNPELQDGRNLLIMKKTN